MALETQTRQAAMLMPNAAPRLATAAATASLANFDLNSGGHSTVATLAALVASCD